MNKLDHASEHLVGIQAQNLYLINYLNKLEFLYSDARKQRKREAKAQNRKLKKLLAALYRHDPQQALSIEKYIGLVDEPLDSLITHENKRRSLMFSYKS